MSRPDIEDIERRCEAEVPALWDGSKTLFKGLCRAKLDLRALLDYVAELEEQGCCFDETHPYGCNWCAVHGQQTKAFPPKVPEDELA